MQLWQKHFVKSRAIQFYLKIVGWEKRAVTHCQKILLAYSTSMTQAELWLSTQTPWLSLKWENKVFFRSSYVGLILLNYLSPVADQLLKILFLQNAFIPQKLTAELWSLFIGIWGKVLYSLKCIQNTVIREHLLIYFKKALFYHFPTKSFSVLI